MRLLPTLLLLPGCVWISDDDYASRYADLTDRDSDGYQDAAAGGDDCDDDNASIHPGAVETCNGEDDDCDGTADDGLLLPWYADADADGYGDPDTLTLACTAPSGAVEDATDCDDSDARINPGADELCNGVDDDCDGATDEADATDATTWYTDADGDGYGDPSQHSIACAQPTGAVADATDCDDGDAAVHPGAAESCNGVDDDCDGDTDEPGATGGATWYQDGDGDGYGDAGDSLAACTQPTGYVASELATDCDDSDAAIHPDALEILADSDDSDCDGGDDSFPFSLLDTRAAQDVEGPRLAQGGGSVYLGWAAERMTDGTRTYDAVAVHVLDDEAPWEGEVDFWSSSQSADQAYLEGFDMVANATYWATASAWLGTYRTIQLDGVNATSHVHGSYRADSAWTMPFDQLQAGLSTVGNITAIGCGLAGSGLHAVQYSVANLTTGIGGPGANSVIHGSSDDHDVCEYDHYAYQFDTFTSDGRHLDYYILSGGILTPSSSSTGTWLAQDFELTTENGFLVMALADLSSGYGFLFQIVDLGSASQGSYWSTSPTALRSIDASVSPSGVAYGCGVDDAGTAYLLWSDILEIAYPVLNTTALHAADLTTVEDCAITVTADSVAVIALRGGDDIAYASVLVP
ncbi:MAG: putative metal-binding motif-containing protein [Pseudomonadota bacterium]